MSLLIPEELTQGSFPKDKAAEFLEKITEDQNYSDLIAQACKLLNRGLMSQNFYEATAPKDLETFLYLLLKKICKNQQNLDDLLNYKQKNKESCIFAYFIFANLLSTQTYKEKTQIFPEICFELENNLAIIANQIFASFSFQNPNYKDLLAEEEIKWLSISGLDFLKLTLQNFLDCNKNILQNFEPFRVGNFIYLTESSKRYSYKEDKNKLSSDSLVYFLTSLYAKLDYCRFFLEKGAKDPQTSLWSKDIEQILSKSLKKIKDQNLAILLSQEEYLRYLAHERLLESQNIISNKLNPHIPKSEDNWRGNSSEYCLFIIQKYFTEKIVFSHLFSREKLVGLILGLFCHLDDEMIEGIEYYAPLLGYLNQILESGVEIKLGDDLEFQNKILILREFLVYANKSTADIITKIYNYFYSKLDSPQEKYKFLLLSTKNLRMEKRQYYNRFYQEIIILYTKEVENIDKEKIKLEKFFVKKPFLITEIFTFFQLGDSKLARHILIVLPEFLNLVKLLLEVEKSEDQKHNSALLDVLIRDCNSQIPELERLINFEIKQLESKLDVCEPESKILY